MSQETKRLFLAALSLLSFFLLAVGATFAWFILSSNASTDDLLLRLDGETFEYHFYVYQDASLDGNASPALDGAMCSMEVTDHCYMEIENPTPAHLMNGGKRISPGNRFSFALKLKNIGAEDLVFSLILSDLHSSGFVLPTNKIQVAFEYTVTKIVYFDGLTESSDIKQTLGIVFAGMNSEIDTHFTAQDGISYELAGGLPLGFEGNNQSLILYFDLYFDPFISGFDDEGLTTGNSNAFQNQTLVINSLAIESATN